MTLIEHLEELRYRLVVSFVAIAMGAAVGWFLFDPLVNLLQKPYCDYLDTVPPAQRVTQECGFFFTGALDPVLIKFKLVAVMGLFFALPVVLYQLWAFIVPGLTKRERRLAIPFVAASVFLFVLGSPLRVLDAAEGARLPPGVRRVELRPAADRGPVLHVRGAGRARLRAGVRAARSSSCSWRSPA